MRIFVRDNDARFFFSSRRRHTRSLCDWSSDVCSSDLPELAKASNALAPGQRLEHLVVTQFTDAFDAGVQGDDAPPVQWHDWLLTRREPAVLDGGSVHTWQQPRACTAPAPPPGGGRAARARPEERRS